MRIPTWWFVALLVAGGASPRLASAGPAPTIGWGDTGTPGSDDIDPNCASPDTMTVVVSFCVPDALDGVYRLEGHVDFCTLPATLPSWWRFDAGGCREGELEVTADLTDGPFTHTDPWQGAGVATFDFIAPHINIFRARIDVAVDLAPEDVVSMVPGTEYYAFKIRFLPPSGTCAGCETPACFVINDAVSVLHEGGRTDIPGSNDYNYAMYNGGSGGCPFIISVEPRTWGRTKASFRDGG